MPKESEIEKRVNERVLAIRNKYGELLSLEEIADVFKYKTVEAVRKAHSRGTLPIALYRFPKKSGYYGRADDVAKSIDEMQES